MDLVEKKASCTGCAACLSACRHQAILMKADDKGFLYPKIDREKCVNCGQCKKACPSNLLRGGG